jgi:hypothetical protein
LSFASEHDDRVRERVKNLMLKTELFHTIEEIKAKPEKSHGVRFAKSEIVAALGRLNHLGYRVEKIQRGPDPYYRLHDRDAEQLPLRPREPGDET